MPAWSSNACTSAAFVFVPAAQVGEVRTDVAVQSREPGVIRSDHSALEFHGALGVGERELRLVHERVRHASVGNGLRYTRIVFPIKTFQEVQ